MSRKKPEPEQTRWEFSTFRRPNDYSVGQWRQDCPSSFNGDVQVHKYRITIELVEEPVETVRARLVDLWETCDNHHHWAPLRAAMAATGGVFTTEQGCRRAR